MSLVVFFFLAQPFWIILKYYACLHYPYYYFLGDLFVPTVIQYEGTKRYINLSSEGEARHVCEMCDSKLRQEISRDTWDRKSVV